MDWKILGLTDDANIQSFDGAKDMPYLSQIFYNCAPIAFDKRVL
jgi:hypothetical protein